MKLQILLLAVVTMTTAASAIDDLRSADHDYESPKPGTYSLPVLRPASDGRLLDTSGNPVRLADLTSGRITVMSFIYTRCTAVRACPMATGVLSQLHRESADDPALSKSLRLVSLSFDPEQDSPARMAEYSALFSRRMNAAPWHFMTTRSPEDLRPILSAYDQAVDRKQNPLDRTGPLHHTVRVLLIDRSGNIRNIYGSSTLDPRLVLADVRTLMMETASLAQQH
ncbi:MAG: SCO family protein [Verrucomicrobiales bacterium]|nr:SCO family protein [Verrucomicrobiales bacterium]